MGSEPIRLGLVVSEFNYDVTYLMLQKALSHAKFLGAEIKIVVKSPGCYDVAILVDELLRREDVDAAVVLGAVIQGETKHDEVVAHQVARKLLDLSLEYGKPVALGIIGPGATRVQALERAEEYARRGVEAAIKLVKRLREVRSRAKVEGTWTVE